MWSWMPALSKSEVNPTLSTKDNDSGLSVWLEKSLKMQMFFKFFEQALGKNFPKLARSQKIDNQKLKVENYPKTGK